MHFIIRATPIEDIDGKSHKMELKSSQSCKAKIMPLVFYGLRGVHTESWRCTHTHTHTEFFYGLRDVHTQRVFYGLEGVHTHTQFFIASGMYTRTRTTHAYTHALKVISRNQARAWYNDHLSTV